MDNVVRILQAPKESFFLFGPRGSGKSTWLRSRFPEAIYVDLLAPDVFREYSARPERLEQLIEGEKKRVIVIDEVQKCPDLLPVVHRLIQQDRGLVFVLTGSSARKLKRTGADLLAGRAVLRNMHPFMAVELGKEFSFAKAVLHGLLPIVVRAPVPEDVLKTYAALYLKEEVQAEGLTRNVGNFSRFLEAVSFSHGSILNTSEISRECQVGRKTVDSYLEILEDLLLGFRLPVFTRRAKRIVVQHPKFYYFDAGVFRSIRPAGPLDRPEEIDGAAIEGLVAQHLRAFCAYDPRGYEMFYWRTKSGVEVDFVLYGKAGITAIEVKRSAKVNSKDLAGLRAFGEDYPQAGLFFLYGGKERLKINGVQCVPCDAFLRELSPGMKF